MPLYMYQLSYTPEAVQALVREPQDRIEAVRPAIEEWIESLRKVQGSQYRPPQ